MAKVPALRKQTIPFRSRNQSAQQNQFQEDVFFDLMEAFTELNSLNQEMDRLGEVATTENKFLQLRLSQLQNELSKLQARPAADGSQTAVVFVPAFKPSPDPVGVKQASFDQLHRIATLPPAPAASKVYLHDALTGDTFAPNSTEVRVEPEANNVTIVDTDLRALVDGKDSTTWVRKVYMPVSSPVTEVEAVVTITLPDDIVSTRDVNLIQLHPFPAQSVSIVNVETALDGPFLSVPGFVPQENAGPARLYFPSRPVSRVKITLRQRHWIEENGQKVFYLGAQEIGVYKQGVMADRAEMLIPVTLQGAGPFKVVSISPVIDNQEALSDTTADARSLFTYSLYTVGAQGNLLYTQEQLPVQVHQPSLVLKATLHVDGSTGTTPALSAVKVRYVSG